MITDFKQWIHEIQCNAINIKREKAKNKGNEDNWKSEIWKSPDKNSEIKRRFRDEGVKLGYRSKPSYVTKSGEWLYDFVWRKFDENNNLIEVVLTMEIEVSDMNIKGIMYDFNKLLQADSKYKILIFQLKTEADIELALVQFEKSAKIYNEKSKSEYLLCGWSTDLNEFLFNEFSA